MNLLTLITAKPVLIGLHLGFAILAIDLFLWLLGEIRADRGDNKWRLKLVLVAIIALVLSWLFGGYYYVVYYGPSVKPVINAGSAPWAHKIAMEAKEHIFLFLLPMAVTLLAVLRVDASILKSAHLKSPAAVLAGLIAGIGLFIGLMGFIISSAARWGAI